MMSIASKVTYTSLFGTDGIRDKANEGALSPQNVRRLGRVTGYLLRRSPALFGAKKAKSLRKRIMSGIHFIKVCRGKKCQNNILHERLKI